MINVGIDVAKDKHDCVIVNSDGEILRDVFTVTNDKEGFEELLRAINICKSFSGQEVKVGLEATGHYSHNILGFLLANGLKAYVINPLQTNLYRQCHSLRKTKTDRVDAKMIASMLSSGISLKPYTDTVYRNSDLKSLSRYRFKKVHERSKLKVSVSRLINILFPEAERLFSNLHISSAQTLFSAFPSAKQIGEAHITRLTNILKVSSQGRFGKTKAVEIREAARNSIGTYSFAQSLELKHTIQRIKAISEEISEIEAEMKKLLEASGSLITTIDGISTVLGSMIIAEIDDFDRFCSPDKVLAFAGLSPSTHQSGKVDNSHSHMDKRGSRYLRYAILTAAKCVCKYNPVFAAYLAKKRAEGKHYFVAVSHAAKKLVRLIYAMTKSGLPYAANPQ